MKVIFRVVPCASVKLRSGSPAPAALAAAAEAAAVAASSAAAEAAAVVEAAVASAAAGATVAVSGIAKSRIELITAFSHHGSVRSVRTLPSFRLPGNGLVRENGIIDPDPEGLGETVGQEGEDHGPGSRKKEGDPEG